ncbi:MAG: hypothetical protein AAF544_08910 [Bacteroidota bacterium]
MTNNAKKDQLWRLVKSLTKAEKRNFKMYATRAEANSNAKFVQLFDAMDRLEAPDDVLLLERLPVKNGGQLSNLKRHLYGEIMTSLRLLYINKEIDIELRQQIDYARILYGKGLYLDALRMLERSKQKAVNHNQDILHLEILEFQKLIEARHVTRSRQVKDKMDLLLNESARRSVISLQTSELINVNIQIHGYYIDNGHCRSETELEQVDQFWVQINQRRLLGPTRNETFFEKVNRFQANMWYRYIRLEFNDAQEEALNAANLFDLNQHELMGMRDPDLYLRCLYYVGVMAYLRQDEKQLARSKEKMDAFSARFHDSFNDNTIVIDTTYRELTSLNLYFLRADWPSAHQHAQRLRRKIKANKLPLPPHRLLLMSYKLAALAFARGDASSALDDLNHIIDTKMSMLGEELLLSTRILHLLCHFELGNLSLVDYHLTNVSRLLRRSPITSESQLVAIAGLRKLTRLAPTKQAEIYRETYQKLASLQPSPYEQKATAYLNLSRWLEKKIGRIEPKGGY